MIKNDDDNVSSFKSLVSSFFIPLFENLGIRELYTRASLSQILLLHNYCLILKKPHNSLKSHKNNHHRNF